VKLVLAPQVANAFAARFNGDLRAVRVATFVKSMTLRIQFNDNTTTNQHSDWVDTFVPIEHERVWMGHTAYNRSHWFGRGMPPFPDPTHLQDSHSRS
jgi:hypothetical protein